jgi:hypothetical protein
MLKTMGGSSIVVHEGKRIVLLPRQTTVQNASRSNGFIYTYFRETSLEHPVAVHRSLE